MRRLTRVVSFGGCLLLGLSSTALAADAGDCSPTRTVLETLTSDLASAHAAAASARDPFDFTSDAPHTVRVLEQGADSLLTRLELIDGATTSIDIAAYEATDDMGGRLLLQALTRAAARGVRVSILMDRYEAVGKSIIGQELARELAKARVEVRYYNTAEWWDPLTRTRRNHRKMLIVDDRRMVTGGRNWSDDYWDLTYSGFTFMDRDVLVEGPGVAAAAKSSALHDSHAWTVSAADAFKDQPIVPAAVSRAKDSLRPAKRDADTLATVKSAARAQRATTGTYSAPSVTFVSDLPGAAGPGVMRTHDALMKEIAAAKTSVVIETYDFFPGEKSEKTFASLPARNVKLSVLTNSPLTEGNPMVATYAFESQRRLVRAGADVYGMGGWASPGHTDARPEGTYSYWGTHAKTIVVDSNTVIIGSFNFDPRSGNLNVESGVILRDVPELAREVENAIWNRTQVSYRLKKDGAYDGGPKSAFEDLPWKTRWMKRAEVLLKRPFKGQF